MLSSLIFFTVAWVGSNAPTHSIAVAKHRVCATKSSEREVACMEAATMKTVAVPDDVAGSIVDLHTEGDEVCVRMDTSDTLLCWERLDRPPTLQQAGVRDVAWGTHHRCTLGPKGVVACSGNNDFGQIGNGTRTYAGKPLDVPIPPATQIAQTHNGTCALLEDRTVRCWGDNPVWDDDRRLTPTEVPGVSDVAGLLPDHVAKLRDGSVIAWDVLNDRIEPFSTPRSLPPASDVVGGATGCVLAPDGTVACVDRWPTSTGASNWKAVPGVAGAVELAISDGLHCVRDDAGAMSCWGGRMWFPSAKVSWTPERISGPPPLQEVSVGGDQACGRTKAGEVWCWRDVPRQVVLPQPALSITVAASNACARTKDGIWCWSQSGEKPVRTFETLKSPRFVPNSDDNICVSAGKRLQCIQNIGPAGASTTPVEELPFVPELVHNQQGCVRRRGALSCWEGPSRWNDSSEGSVRPVAFNTRALKALTGGGRRLCGIDRKGEVSCSESIAQRCESGVGRLRRCQTVNLVDALDEVRTLEVGARMACADGSGGLRCWRTTSDHATPAPDPITSIPLVRPMRTLSVGDNTACAVLDDRSVWCWGDPTGPLGSRHRPRGVEATPTRVPWLDRMP